MPNGFGGSAKPLEPRNVACDCSLFPTQIVRNTQYSLLRCPNTHKGVEYRLGFVACLLQAVRTFRREQEDDVVAYPFGVATTVNIQPECLVNRASGLQAHAVTQFRDHFVVVIATVDAARENFANCPNGDIDRPTKPVFPASPPVIRSIETGLT